MTIRINQVRLSIDEDSPAALVAAAARALDVVPGNIAQVRLARKALDARRRTPAYVYTLLVDLSVDERAVLRAVSGRPGIEPWREEAPPPLAPGSEELPVPPVVVGAGPAGLFCALKLAAYGYRPLVLERGRPVEERVRDVESFWAGGKLDPDSNVQFGEGGAGTFSDGKLTTRIHDPLAKEVYALLIEAGAPPEIAYLQRPHLGTDRLRGIVAGLRRILLERGGRIRFRSRVTDLLIERGTLRGVKVAEGGGEREFHEIRCRAAVLATGHSARDTYAMLDRRGVAMAGKPFSVGVRIEHPQPVIDRARYGEWAGHPRLEPADYQLSWRAGEERAEGATVCTPRLAEERAAGRAVYTFCMCPGGRVVAAASEEGGVVTNGMSDAARDGALANSALVVSVGPEDFPGDSPLAGIEFQQTWERAAYRLGGGGYRAPAQNVRDYLAGRPTPEGDFALPPTYLPGVSGSDLYRCLPQFAGELLEEAIRRFDRQLAGFAGPAAVLTGVETRTSAPLRILRGEDGQSVNTDGLYPAGEGAGYAGGIVSSAVDGLRAAGRIIARFRPPA